MANITTYLNNIKNAVFGKDVRGSIHDGIKVMNDEVESTTLSQKVLDSTFNQLIINAGNSNAEVVAARVDESGNSYDNLGKRLNKFDEQFNTKANQTDVNILKEQVPLKANASDIVSLESKKANTVDVDKKIEAVASGSPKGTYNTLNDLKTAFPVGNSNIYLTLDNKNWNYWNGTTWLSGGVYQATSLSDYSVSRNNLNLIYEQGRIVKGEINFNFINDILEISIGTMVSTNNGFYACNNTENIIINHDSFVRYLFFNITTGLFHVEARWFNGKSNELFICAIYNKRIYGVGNNDLIKVDGRNISIKGSIVTNENLNDNSISNSKMGFTTHYGCILEGGINIDTINKKITVNNGTIISDMLGFYVANVGETTFTNDATKACYLFFNKSNGTVHLENRWFYAQNSNELFLGVLYSRKIFNAVSQNIKVNGVNTNVLTNQWLNKKWVSYGDSNTQIGRWQPTVIDKIGLTHINMGVSSSTIVNYPTWAVPMCSDERLNAIPNDADIITILGGTNDWVGHKFLGNIDSVDKTQFFGAYKYIIESIMTRLPNARLVLICPTYSSYTLTTKEKNNIGLTIRDYGNAIKELGYYYNLPVIDGLTMLGVNKLNYLSCFDNEEIVVHLNANGGVRFGNLVAEFIKQL